MRVLAICILLVSVGAFVAAQDLTTNIKVPARTLCQTTRTSLLSDPQHAVLGKHHATSYWR